MYKTIKVSSLKSGQKVLGYFWEGSIKIPFNATVISTTLINKKMCDATPKDSVVFTNDDTKNTYQLVLINGVAYVKDYGKNDTRCTFKHFVVQQPTVRKKHDSKKSR